MGRVSAEVRQRESGMVGTDTESRAEHGLGASCAERGGFSPLGRDGCARHRAGVWWHSMRPEPRGAGEARWYHGGLFVVLDTGVSGAAFLMPFAVRLLEL